MRWGKTDIRCRGKHISYQRGKRNTTPGTSLLKLEGVDNTDAAQFYAGKRVAYVYRAQRTVQGSKVSNDSPLKARISIDTWSRSASSGARSPVPTATAVWSGPSSVRIFLLRASYVPAPQRHHTRANRRQGASVRVMLYPSSI